MVNLVLFHLSCLCRVTPSKLTGSGFGCCCRRRAGFCLRQCWKDPWGQTWYRCCHRWSWIRWQRTEQLSDLGWRHPVSHTTAWSFQTRGAGQWSASTCSVFEMHVFLRLFYQYYINNITDFVTQKINTFVLVALNFTFSYNLWSVKRGRQQPAMASAQ